MSSKKRIFITGASSLLMQQTLSHLDSSEFEVFGLTRNKSIAENSKINWVIGDILSPNSYREIVAECDIIIHAAAITHARNKNLYHQVNVEGTQSLLQAIPEGKNPKFILVSSRVAGEKSGAYGQSKLQGEAIVKKQCKSWLIIRPSEIYGGTKAEGIEKTIQSALGGGLQLCPVGEESKMYPIHISDASTIMYNAIFEEKKENEIVYINGEKGYSFKELLKMIETVSGTKMTVLPIPKWFLSLVAVVSKILPVDIGFVPDQVDRLYSVKNHGTSSKEILKIEDYVKKQIQNK